MPQTARRRPRKIVLVLAFAIATVLALGLAELALRFVPQRGALGAIGYADSAGVPVKGGAEAKQRGLIVVATKKPRLRTMFAPGQTFYLTYTDNDVLKRDWLDEQGRIANTINSRGLREREEIGFDKPEGQRRIVCVGDSFTFGWGIPVEQGWVRLLEDELRKQGDDVRTVNCGAAGAILIDEYVHALKTRFGKYQPDAVVLTICLNDLMPSSGVDFAVSPQPTGIRLLDLLRGVLHGDPRELDPERDWVQELLDLPEDQANASQLCNPIQKPWAAMWPRGLPQQALREGRDWCRERGIPFLVVIWPFLQWPGEEHRYPFQKMHDLVAAFCEQEQIPLLDVTPSLIGTDCEDLWVTPADPHPAPLAQRLALPAIVDFVRGQTGW